MSKVRIYDLAKELKLESKKVLEDARRLGVDVSVPSNTLEDPIAAKIREMYYPKKEVVAAKPTARLIKHPTAAAPAPATIPEFTESPASITPEKVEAKIEKQHTEQPAAQRPATATILKPLTPPVKAEPQAKAPAKVAPEIEAKAPVQQPTAPKPSPAEAEAPKSRLVKLQQPTKPVPATELTGELPIEEVVEPKSESAEPAVGLEATVVEAPEITAQEPTQETEPSTAEPPAQPVPQPTVHKSQPKPASAPNDTGTKVIKLAMPTRPLPKPSPTTSARFQSEKPALTTKSGATGKLDPSLLLKKDQTRDLKPKDPHLLPSGAQQRTVYIPPKDQKPKGRNQHRGKDKDRDKFQDGNTHKLGLRKQNLPAAAKKLIPAELKPVRLVEGSTVREFAEKLDVKARDVVAALMQRGVMATINQIMNHDLAIELGYEYGFEVTFGDFEDMIIESEFEITPEAMDDTDPRAPVITVMGHVDHGKTSLLDAIRSARVAEGEAGGITQHIGAYSVEVPSPENPSVTRRVVFLDTPGHEAFTLMRARGAKVTDIVVLVVAADDGVMPQTIEAIEHSRAAKVPIIVAINKVDKPDANPERVKKELADRNVLWSNWGGDVEMVEVSAKNRQNIDGLLEMILLTADILELKSNPKRKATGTVLEAKLDRGRGAVATVLVQNGTLRIGDPFIVGNFSGRVRALVNDLGERVQETGPATPVEVLGLEGVPSAGDQFQVVDDVVKAQQIAQFRQAKARTTALARSAARGLDQLAAQMESGEVKELLVILKADVQGSVEVLKDTLTKLSTSKVKVRIIRSAVGAITYDDVLLASASQATDTGAATVIIGFNVRPESRAEEIAKQEDVDIRLHSIIYKVEEEIRNAMLGLMDATLKDVALGKAEVRDIIRVPKVGAIAGCMVINGSIKRAAQARLIRNNVVIFESTIGSLRRFKDDASEVQQGYECGITVERFSDYKIGDIIEAYIVEKVAPTQL